MNHAVFAGRLGRDAETRNTQSGHQVTGWPLAVDEYAGQGERRTLWIDCSMWGERGAKLAEFLKKGTPVTVAGQVGVRTYEAQGETKAVITLNVREITLQGSRADGEGQRPAPQRPAPTRSTPAAGRPQQPEPDPDSDIPF